MTDHSKNAQIVQFDSEITEGTAVPTTKQLATMTVDFSPDATFMDISPSGNKFYTLSILGKEWVAGDAKLEHATFEEMLYILASYASYSAPTQLSATGVSMWQRSTAYALAAFVSPYPTNGIVYKCTTAGTSGTLPPVWPTTADATVTDGTAVWTCMKWKVARAYALNDIVTPTNTSNGYYFKVTTAGTSHASTEPTWPTTGTVTDGTITWTTQGVYSFAFQYTLTPNANTQDVSKTYTFEWGEPSTVAAASQSAYRATGVFVNEFGMEFDRDKLPVSAKLLGRREQPGISISPFAGVTAVPLKPLIPGRSAWFYSLVSMADLANETNRFTREMMASLKMPPKFNLHWPMDDQLESFGARTEAKQLPEFSFTVGADANPPVANAWAPNTAYTTGTHVYGTGAAKGVVFKCSTSGTSGYAPPAWNTTAQATTSDGTAVWTCRKWTTGQGYSLNDITMPSTANGFVYLCTTAGTTSASSEPSWPVLHGQTVADGSAVFTAKSVDFTDPFTVDRMRRSSTIFIRYKSTTTDYIGTTNVPYTLIMDFAVKIGKPFKQLDVDGSLMAVEWPCKGYYDAVALKAYQFVLKCATPYV